MSWEYEEPGSPPPPPPPPHPLQPNRCLVREKLSFYYDNLSGPGHEITVGSCDIQNGGSNALATATFGGSPRTTSSCIVNENCNYEVHVLGNYESNGQHSFRNHNTGFTDLYITGSTARRLILVLSSYEPVEWLLHIPAGVVIERVIIVSGQIIMYMDVKHRNR